MFYEEHRQLAELRFKENHPWIIGRALKKINELRVKENKPIRDPKRGHHVINKGVNDLCKDIIRDCFVKTGCKKIYNELRNLNIIDENGLLNHNAAPRFFDIPKEIKSKIDSMKVHKPEKDEKYISKNDLQFGCAKIVLLACLHCVMLDIFNRHLQDEEMPNLDDTLKNLRIIIAYDFIQKNEHGVYVDVKAKEWWDKENPGKEQDFAKCKKSVETFLKSITDNSHGILTFGKWLVKLYKLEKSNFYGEFSSLFYRCL